MSLRRWEPLGGQRDGQPLADEGAILRIVDDQWIRIEGVHKVDSSRFAGIHRGSPCSDFVVPVKWAERS